MADAPQQVVDALTQALNGEYSAAYAYGVIGAYTTGNDRTRALKALQIHQRGRDDLRAQFNALGVTPPPPASGYTTTPKIDSVATAKQVAISVEQHQTQMWSLVASVSGGDDRKKSVHAAQDCAVRAIAWGAKPSAF